ncbi:MAG: DMT family transporter [Hyphomonadaceae bacterium]|nr:DMT family transporter [Hyphomonadaceae bacterium]MBX3510981.1 DMT family transporter [Hyphomonadaceae bacterium]
MRALPPSLVLTIAVVAGASMDATIKYLSQTNSVLLVAFGRYAFGALFSALIYWRAGLPKITAAMWRAHALRGVVIAACAVTFFWALTVLPLAEAVTLSFIYPLLAPFVAWMLLGERVRRASIAAAGLGFVGVVIAAQGAPSTEDSPMHALGVSAVLASACLFALAMVLLRQRAQSDGPVIVSLMTSVIPGLLVAGPAIAFSAPPHPPDWPVFLMLGAFAAVFMYLMAAAYARAEAQRLAPIHYTELLWASAIGYVIFHETPRPQIYLGAALIVAACLYVAYEERRLALRSQTT